ncbi:DUF5017 domain-containing protein [Sphingobacterium sp. SGG-5]|uniref:DUF5017 domain-containing protein n=1 Tax=Sphingobacterium sp. SGG-5 TaxID=2710881 RepID=UPI0013EC6055|nr:DUF5017 domain-containing protein [Sphingobacterium sp. SGG-5]NGM63045.1 DUF5017 domain-containing protein [Sphingobacterium sp. SGG-5]
MKWISALLILVIISSCSKVDFKTAELEVYVDDTAYKVGDPIFFNIKSNADNIVFYSGVAYGDTLNEYKSRDGREIPIENLKMSFSTKLGTAGTQVDQLRILVSTDFNGIYSEENVDLAQWIDITSEFTLSTSTAVVNSGEHRLNQYTEPGKPLYVCFKYIARPRTTYKTARDVTISEFLITNEGGYGKHDVVTFTRSGFAAATAVRKGNFTPTEGRTVFSNTSIQLRANNAAGTTDEYTETWVISKPINTDFLNLGPDASIPLKGYKELKQEAFYYTYYRPGAYTATFVAFNMNKDEISSVVKEIDIKVGR